MSSPIGRYNREAKARLERIMKERFEKGLSKKTRRGGILPKATDLILKCPSWANVELELKTLPEKKKNGK